MKQGIQVTGIYVRDQDEALAFYVERIGFQVHTDVRNGDYRWLTVRHPEQPDFQLGLFRPGSPLHDEATALTLQQMVAKGAMPPLVLQVDDCVAVCERMRAQGVEFTVTLDEKPREVDVPDDLRSALDAQAEARIAFDALPFGLRQKHVRHLEDAKSVDTRNRRLAKLVSGFAQSEV